MRTDVARVSTLGNSTIGVLSTICVDLVRAVVLLVSFAVVACKVGSYLCADADSVALLKLCDLGADIDDLADDLVAYTKREGNVFSPPASDCVNIGGADTAGIDCDIDIVFFKLFQRQLVKVLVL